MSAQMTRNWIWCLNNPTEAETPTIESWKAKYIAWGREVGEEGTPHWQGCVVFHTNRRLSALKRLNDRVHWEHMKGSFSQASDYCFKDGDFTELGEPPMQPKRKGEMEKERWRSAFQLIKEGKIHELEELEPSFYGRNMRTFQTYAAQHPLSRAPLTQIKAYWIHGVPGSGKSHWARTKYPDHYKKNTNKWWDGYKDQETVVIDEWAPHHFYLADHLKKWADIWDFTAEVKGGTINIRPKRIIVTSNYSLEECFPSPQDFDALSRRFRSTFFSRVYVSPQLDNEVLSDIEQPE